MIERKIIIGLITSTKFLKEVRANIIPELLQDSAAKILAEWALEFFDSYKKAPQSNMEQIFYTKMKSLKIDDEIVEEIEEDILPGLSDEYEREGFDIEPLVKQTQDYFEERKLDNLKETVEVLLDRGDWKEAKRIVDEYKSAGHVEDELIISRKHLDGVDDEIEQAFVDNSETLIEYPGALGEMFNKELIRGAFVAFLAAEKRGKSALLLDMLKRGYIQGKKIAFFQAGDMSRRQQIRRLGINLCGKSDKEKNAGIRYIPVRDCILNQRGECDKKVRESRIGILFEREENEILQEITKDELIEFYENNPSYRPCYNCKAWNKGLGTVWYEKIYRERLEVDAAKQVVKQFFKKYKGEFRMSTYPNDTLTVSKMKEILYTWEMRDGFIPDIILVDYADILAPDAKGEFRHSQNQIWKGLRSMNQEFDCLLVTVTQADANSYEQASLKLKNFSEDKRKYGHVTAFYGMNQDPKGREKQLGIMRINELMLREDEYNPNRQVVVLQDLSCYRAVIGSFWRDMNVKKKEEDN